MDETEKQLMEALARQEPAGKQDYVATARGTMAGKLATMEEIIGALRTVTDPEIPINIYDLGLIYDIKQAENGDVKIDMTVTSPMCPVAGILPMLAANAVALVEGTNAIEVKIVWEPAWTLERLTEEAKAILELF